MLVVGLDEEFPGVQPAPAAPPLKVDPAAAGLMFDGEEHEELFARIKCLEITNKVILSFDTSHDVPRR